MFLEANKKTPSDECIWSCCRLHLALSESMSAQRIDPALGCQSQSLQFGLHETITHLRRLDKEPVIFC